MNAKLVSAIFALILTLGFNTNSQADAGSTKRDSIFFYGVKKVIFETSNDVFYGSLPLDRKVSPFTEHDLDDLVRNVFKEQIQARQIKVETAKEAGVKYDESFDKSIVFVKVRVSYWEKTRFSPEINHDIIAIETALKRNQDWTDASGMPMKQPQQIVLQTLLVSAPEKKEESYNALKKALSKELKQKISSPINCINLRKCSR